jgi:hypothetical protein
VKAKMVGQAKYLGSEQPALTLQDMFPVFQVRFHDRREWFGDRKTADEEVLQKLGKEDLFFPFYEDIVFEPGLLDD